MEAKKKKFASVDEYISTLPHHVQAVAEQVRRAVRSAVPGIEEKISYDMAGYFYRGTRLVYFGAFKKHIGFYPAHETVFKSFNRELSAYPQSGRGTVQFPYSKPVPLELIAEIVRFRALENELPPKS